MLCFYSFIWVIFLAAEFDETLKRLDRLEHRLSEVMHRIDEIGMQLEAINKTFICLYRSGDLDKCAVRIGAT